MFLRKGKTEIAKKKMFQNNSFATFYVQTIQSYCSFQVKLKYAELSRLPQRNRIHNEKEETVVVQTCSSSAKKLAEEYTVSTD